MSHWQHSFTPQSEPDCPLVNGFSTILHSAPHPVKTLKTICLWSGPRNVSTALMYSFAQRADTRVVDEPLYGHYLRVSGSDHPGGADVMASMNCNGNAVLRELFEDGTERPPVLFIKHMAHHLVEIDTSFLTKTLNAFLIRDPYEMLPSLTIQVPNAGLSDTGLKRQCELFDELCRAGQDPAIIDSRELLLDPAGVIGAFCERVDIDFDAHMLRWKAGPILEDGCWAEHWYHSVHKSTGFSKYEAKHSFPAHLQSLLAECRPYYEQLHVHAIKARPSQGLTA